MPGSYMKMHQWGVATAEFREAALKKKKKKKMLFYFVSARHSSFAKRLRQKTETV